MSRRPTRPAEDRLVGFLRGLVIGAFVGAFIAGSAALRRLLDR
jgi:hypothetical protein